MAIVSDQGIDWLRKRIWIPPFYMQGIGMHAAADVVLHSIETILAEYNEVTDVGMGTLMLGDGEFINGYILCPIDLDPKYPVGFRIAWTAVHNSGVLTASWILLQNSLAHGATIALPATALNTVIALLDAYVDADGTASTDDFKLQMTSRGVRTDIGLNRAQIEAGAFLTFKIEMDAAAAETSIRYIGLEMDYVPWQTRGTGPSTDRKLKADGST